MFTKIDIRSTYCNGNEQACKLKFRLRVLTSCLCSAADAWAVCFEGHMAGLDTTETGNEFSQSKF